MTALKYGLMTLKQDKQNHRQKKIMNFFNKLNQIEKRTKMYAFVKIEECDSIENSQRLQSDIFNFSCEEVSHAEKP